MQLCKQACNGRCHSLQCHAASLPILSHALLRVIKTSNVACNKGAVNARLSLNLRPQKERIEWANRPCCQHAEYCFASSAKMNKTTLPFSEATLYYPHFSRVSISMCTVADLMPRKQLATIFYAAMHVLGALLRACTRVAKHTHGAKAAAPNVYGLRRVIYRALIPRRARGPCTCVMR